MEVKILFLAFILNIVVGFCFVYKLGSFLEEDKENEKDSDLHSMTITNEPQKASEFRLSGGVTVLRMIRQFYLKHQIKRNIF